MAVIRRNDAMEITQAINARRDTSSHLP
jgi:hypothetical protein